MFQSGDILLAIMVFQLGDHRAYITRPYRVDQADPPGADANTVAERINAAVTSVIAAELAFPARLRGTWIRRIHPGVGPLEGENTTIPAVVPVPGGPLPAQTAGLVKLRSPDRGVVRDGLVFVPFLPASSLGADGRWNPVGIAQLNIIGSTLMVNVPNIILPPLFVLRPVLWSRKRSRYATATERVASPRVATQRRRSFMNTPTRLPFGMGPPSV